MALTNQSSQMNEYKEKEKLLELTFLCVRKII